MIQEMKGPNAVFKWMEEGMFERKIALESAERSRYFSGIYLQRISQFAAAQPLESRLCDMETMRGMVDGSNIDRPIIRFVSQCPAPAAVGGMKGDVESAADTREGGKISERLETWEEVRACDALEGASFVVSYTWSNVTRRVSRGDGSWRLICASRVDDSESR